MRLGKEDHCKEVSKIKIIHDLVRPIFLCQELIRHTSIRKYSAFGKVGIVGDLNARCGL